MVGPWISWGLGSAPGWPRVETTLGREKALALEQMRKDGQSEAVAYPILCRATPFHKYKICSFDGLGTLAFALVPTTGAASPWPVPQTALLISGLVTFIAAYHYFRIFNRCAQGQQEGS